MAYKRLKVGQRIRITRDIDMHPHTLVQRGETGEVVYANAEDHVWDIRLHKSHPGISSWENIISITPYEDEVSRSVSADRLVHLRPLARTAGYLVAAVALLMGLSGAPKLTAGVKSERTGIVEYQGAHYSVVVSHTPGEPIWHFLSLDRLSDDPSLPSSVAEAQE